jgi:hypothetical protein
MYARHPQCREHLLATRLCRSSVETQLWCPPVVFRNDAAERMEYDDIPGFLWKPKETVAFNAYILSSSTSYDLFGTPDISSPKGPVNDVSVSTGEVFDSALLTTYVEDSPR